MASEVQPPVVAVVYSELQRQQVAEDYLVAQPHSNKAADSELNNKANLVANPNNQQAGSSVHLELKREPGASGLQPPEDLEPERLLRPREAEAYLEAEVLRSEEGKQEQEAECLVAKPNHSNIWLAKAVYLAPLNRLLNRSAHLPEPGEACSDQQTRLALVHHQRLAVLEHQQVAVAACLEQLLHQLQEGLALLPAVECSEELPPALQVRLELHRRRHLARRNSQPPAPSVVADSAKLDSNRQEEHLANKQEEHLVNSKEALVNRAAQCPIGHQLTNVLMEKSQLCIINQSLSWGNNHLAVRL